jgi:TolB protein
MRSRTLTLLAALTTTAASAVVAAPAAQAGGYATASFVFTREAAGDTEIMLRRTDGSVVALTNNRVADFGAVWSPDGRLLAFSRQVGEGTALFVMRADGSGVRRLTTPVESPSGRMSMDFAPTWSPDGQQIAFASDRASFETEIFRIRADGVGLTRLTRTEDFVGDTNPAWSPDGNWIYFESDRVGVFNHEIFRMLPDGTGVQRITRTADGVDDGMPDLTRDGIRVVFMSTRVNGSQDLFTMRPDGSDVRRLGTPTAGQDEFFPEWTADGQRVLYTLLGSPEDPNGTIWTIDADGTDRRRLTSGRHDDSMADPYPVPPR